MFTGLIEEIGVLDNIKRQASSAALTISCPKIAAKVSIGDSVAVNGCCLTVVDIAKERLSFDAMPETIEKTNLNRLIRGDEVNIEPSLRVGDELGGHFVSGHIDGIAYVANIVLKSNSREIELSSSSDLLNMIVKKGSVALDGVSLTVIDVATTTLTVGIIPHTWENTIIKRWKTGTIVNIETDIIGKYIKKMMTVKKSPLEMFFQNEE